MNSKFFSDEFLALAERFQRQRGTLLEIQLLKDAGRLFIGTVKAGYLKSTGAAELVAHYESPDEDDPNKQAQRAGCPENLFLEVVNNAETIFATDDEQPRPVKDFYAASACKALERGDQVAYRSAMSQRAEHQRDRAATACRLVARLLEKNDTPAESVTPPPADGMFTVGQLAKKHELPAEALRRRLERWRKNHRDTEGIDWRETTHKGQFIYRESAVLSVIEDHKIDLTKKRPGASTKPSGTK